MECCKDQKKRKTTDAHKIVIQWLERIDHMDAPAWQNMIHPKSCAKCAKPYSKEAFESLEKDSDTIFDRMLHRTWCKDCEQGYMEEREKT